MKKSSTRSVFTGLVLSVLLVSLSLVGVKPVQAASSPTLGTASTYSILAGSAVTNTGASTVSGDVGISPGVGSPHYSGFGTVTLGGTLHDADGAAATAQGDKNLAYAALDVNACGADGGTDYGAVVKSLNGLTLAPGVYCANQFNLSGTLTLNGPSTGVWIFKSAGSLVVSGGAAAKIVFTGGGLPCNVWWRVVSTASFDANSSLAGNILADTSITMAAGATLDGRALARTAEVTLSSNSITGPTCAAAPAPSSGTNPTGTINVVKIVINDNGGTGTIADFPLFINDRSVVSGATTTLSSDSTYTVHETSNASYAQSFSGDCDADGHVFLSASAHLFCVITNDDIGVPTVVPPVPPLIDVVKVPSPLALPDGPGDVEYSYSLTNIGTVPVTDITMVDDSCSSVVLDSGDTNSDEQLDLNETWSYTCTTTLSETHTNTVVATGWANGLSVADIATATVVVGEPTVPPLIHVTKIPSALTLPIGGGPVIYTETITNPGTVPLSNVTLTDDKCDPVTYISGDTNEDSLLDSTESWVYSCNSSLTETTTNTAIAGGRGNGIMVRDFAIATVVVAAYVPSLPDTGYAPSGSALTWGFIAAIALGVALTFFLIARRKRIF